MNSFPMILVREFNGRETSYRVAARRACNYWVRCLEYQLSDDAKLDWRSTEKVLKGR